MPSGRFSTVKLLLAGLVVVLAVPAAAPARTSANCSHTSVAMTPLTDLGKRTYHGYRGGLYANGKNTPPIAYLKAGLAQADEIKPIDGKIVLLSVGMSNTTLEYSTFKRLADADPRKNPELEIVDGAKGGQDAEAGKDPNARLWAAMDVKLNLAEVTPAQVQAVWLKETILRESRPFPADAKGLKRDLVSMVGILRAKFPNLRLIYLSSRTYGGYGTSNFNPEPYSYDGGFGVKWLILDRIRGKLTGPWLEWGPYLWTNGEKGRKDGLVWNCSDTAPADGMHPSDTGQAKVAKLLLHFFTTDPTARCWFVKPGG
jgi:hypothetical protein